MLANQVLDIVKSKDVEDFIRWCSAHDMSGLYALYRVQEHRYWSELNWENRCRLLFNRIKGQQRHYRKYYANALSKAMDAHKALWRDLYNDPRCATPAEWLKLVLAVNDTLQQHGHEGVWGGCVTYAKVADGYSYRNLYHDKPGVAYNEELYSLLYGWW